MEQYFSGFWDGKPAKFRVVKILIGKEPDRIRIAAEAALRPGIRRLLWFIPFIGHEREVIEVVLPTDSEPFYIDNKDGSGLKKVLEGRGSFKYFHRTIYTGEILSEVRKEDWQRHWPALQDRIEEEIDIAWRRLDEKAWNEARQQQAGLMETIKNLRGKIKFL